ncbi:MAG: chorismate synthase [Candidatus Hadarchaeales archaeon]
MGGNSFGKIFRVTSWGESHGKCVGVVVDGVPAGLELSEDDIQKELDKRRPGTSKVVSGRKEPDRVEILSGVFRGKTIGTPIGMLVRNVAFDSGPYEEREGLPRPGHADLTYLQKFGHVDLRGGGRASGRETVARVAAGAIAKKLLKKFGIEVLAHTVEIGGIQVDRDSIKLDDIRAAQKNPVRCADRMAARKMMNLIEETKKKGNSVGGVVEIIALGVPAGLGEPVFDKLDAHLAWALMSIGGIKGVELGAGFRLTKMNGSEANDQYSIDPKTGRIFTKSNNSGGVLGGISNGMPIVARIAVKPTSSISLPQHTVNLKTMKVSTLKIRGKHDPCLCPRVVPVAEAMVAIVLADHMLRSGMINPDKLDKVR